MSNAWPVKVTVRRCECGRVWVGGNSKYCAAGHAYRFVEREYVPVDRRGLVEQGDAE